MTNLGLRRLLEGFAGIAPSPRPVAAETGGRCEIDGPFAGLVFKIQANSNPRHRDRIAFLRIASGRFERGMTLTNARTGRPLTLRFAHELLGRDRVTIDDTLYADEPVTFPPITTFAPERFVRVRNVDTNRYKRFRAGLVQLDEEGVIHVLRRPGVGDQERILGAVGELQFEVARYRLEHEFGCPVSMTNTPWVAVRRVEGPTTAISSYGVSFVEESRGQTLALFESTFALARILKDTPAGLLVPVGIDATDPLSGYRSPPGLPLTSRDDPRPKRLHAAPPVNRWEFAHEHLIRDGDTRRPRPSGGAWWVPRPSIPDSQPRPTAGSPAAADGTLHLSHASSIRVRDRRRRLFGRLPPP